MVQLKKYYRFKIQYKEETKKFTLGFGAIFPLGIFAISGRSNSKRNWTELSLYLGIQDMGQQILQIINKFGFESHSLLQLFNSTSLA